MTVVTPITDTFLGKNTVLLGFAMDIAVVIVGLNQQIFGRVKKSLVSSLVIFTPKLVSSKFIGVEPKVVIKVIARTRNINGSKIRFRMADIDTNIAVSSSVNNELFVVISRKVGISESLRSSGSVNIGQIGRKLIKLIDVIPKKIALKFLRKSLGKSFKAMEFSLLT